MNVNPPQDSLLKKVSFDPKYTFIWTLTYLYYSTNLPLHTDAIHSYLPAQTKHKSKSVVAHFPK